MKAILAVNSQTLTNERKRQAEQDEYRAEVEKKMTLMSDIR